jgi:hypothetical protein
MLMKVFLIEAKHPETGVYYPLHMVFSTHELAKAYIDANLPSDYTPYAVTIDIAKPTVTHEFIKKSNPS